MVSHAVQLDALMIVNVKVLCLGNREHMIVLQEANVSHFVTGLELHDKVLVFPFKHGEVTFTPAKKYMLAISRHCKA